MTEKWSQDVTEHSDALDLEEGVFTWNDPKRIARSLKSLGGKEQAAQGKPAAIGDVDAHLLRQPRRQGLGRGSEKVLESAKEELRRALKGVRRAARRGTGSRLPPAPQNR